jgi:hypothetical protein
MFSFPFMKILTFSIIVAGGYIAMFLTATVILVGNQIDAQFFMIYLFESSTYFEQLCAHSQEDNCSNTLSGIITLKTKLRK